MHKYSCFYAWFRSQNRPSNKYDNFFPDIYNGQRSNYPDPIPFFSSFPLYVAYGCLCHNLINTMKILKYKINIIFLQKQLINDKFKVYILVQPFGIENRRINQITIFWSIIITIYATHALAILDT